MWYFRVPSGQDPLFSSRCSTTFEFSSQTEGPPILSVFLSAPFFLWLSGLPCFPEPYNLRPRATEPIPTVLFTNHSCYIWLSYGPNWPKTMTGVFSQSCESVSHDPKHPHLPYGQLQSNPTDSYEIELQYQKSKTLQIKQKKNLFLQVGLSKPGLQEDPLPFFKALDSKMSVECYAKDLNASEGFELVSMGLSIGTWVWSQCINFQRGFPREKAERIWKIPGR